jgi:probable phosphomutase (TIGR03848 family)
MPMILLVRHGENDYVKKGRLAGRLPGVHLNEKGREQAQAVAEKLSGAAIKAVYSSPMERAMETAEPIAKALGLDVVVRQGLIEVDVGEWQDKKLKGLKRLKIWRKVQQMPSVMRFPGGETFAQAQHRITQELQTLADQHEPKDIIVCVSHSDPIKLAVSYFIGQPLDLFQRLSVMPASISALYFGEEGSFLLTLNYDLSFTLPKS